MQLAALRQLLRMFKTITLLSLLGLSAAAFTQVLPAARSVNWKIAGLRDTSTTGFTIIDMQAHGISGDGVTPNDAALSNVLSGISGPGAILVFPAGNFLLNNPVQLPGNLVIKGQGADATTFTFSLNGNGNAFNIEGAMGADTTLVVQSAAKAASSLTVFNASSFHAGDWVQLIQQDTDLVTSTWAYNSVGQIVQIASIGNNQLTLASPLRMDYQLARMPYIRKLNTISNVGIECIKIRRTDNTAPQQSSNIRFTFAENCWVSGIESENCTFSHIDATSCSNLQVSKSYFHHAFEYGDGGRGYGIMLQATTGESRVEDNVFEHLRHSMIVQSGANGNVFAFNYSTDPYWPQIAPVPTNSAGDMVLHGNYVYSNLFEQNICQNIVIDNSHGPNGPYNTFFRNRASGFGIYFSDNTSPSQNLIANEIPNTGFPYSLGNYNILGTGHFIYGNNNKGTIDPAGTVALADSSYAYAARPAFEASGEWAAIGTPNVMGSGYNQAYYRKINGTLFNNACGNSIAALDELSANTVLIYPNPADAVFTVETTQKIKTLFVINTLGEILSTYPDIPSGTQIAISNHPAGIYLIQVVFASGLTQTRKISML